MSWPEELDDLLRRWEEEWNERIEACVANPVVVANVEARCECGAAFVQGQPGRSRTSLRTSSFRYDRTCWACGKWVPPPSRAQFGKIIQLAELLGIKDFEQPLTPPQAAKMIDDLVALARLDPDVGVCAAPGCDYFVRKRRKTKAARTYCRRHRRDSGR